MTLFFFALFLFFVEPIYPDSNNREINLVDNLNLNEFNINRRLELFSSSSNQDQFLKILESLLILIEENGPSYKESIQNILKMIPGIQSYSEIVNEILNVAFDPSNLIVNKTLNLIRNQSEIIDDLIYIIENKNNTGIVFRNLSAILKLPEFKDWFNYTYETDKDLIPDIAKILLKDSKMSSLLLFLNNNSFQYQDDLVNLTYNLIEHFGEKNNLAIIIRDFCFNINNKGSKMFQYLKELEQNYYIFENISDLIELGEGREIEQTIVKGILSNHEIMLFVMDYFTNNTIIDKITDITLNIENNSYISKKIPELADYVFGDNLENFDIITKAFISVLGKLFDLVKFKYLIGNEFFKYFMNSQFFTESHFYDKIGKNCSDFINYVLFANFTEENLGMRHYYTKKLLIETTKNKNDFLSYENCLGNITIFKYGEKNEIRPIFLIGIINDNKSKTKLKDSILQEKYNYLSSFCLPSLKKKEKEEDICDKEDFNNLIKFFFEASNNMDDSKVESFYFDEDQIALKYKDYLYFIIIILFLMFPLLIKLFLLVYQTIKENRQQKGEINNKLNMNNDDNNNREDSIKDNEDLIFKKINSDKSFNFIWPKWYMILNEYFDIIENCKELFKFSSDKTEYNDFNGITYIKGILGLSIFLNIFGLTFFILFNLPHKNISTRQFYDTINNPFYIILFIGLRYSPRVIFSCSGYTLIYKYLFFLESNTSYSFLKFLMCNSYKYILLIIIALYMRFLIFYIDVIFRDKKSIMMEVFKYILQNNDQYFFSNLFSFFFYNSKEKVFDYTEAVIQYLYLPINEVFLFIFGIILITLGYKFKIRIDLIIIGFILLFYILKIVFFGLYFNKEQIYSTLYFYLFGYGAIMVNPLFNLPSFLIGMYFGLINFTIQRGINASKISSNRYTRVELNDPNKNEIQKVKRETMNSSFFYKEKKSINYKNSHDKEEDKNPNLRNNRKSLLFEEEDSIAFWNDLEKKKENDDYDIIPDEKYLIKEMPFLKSAINFTDFHRRNMHKNYFVILLIISLIIFIGCVSAIYIFIKIYIDPNERNIDNLALNKIIPNLTLNIIYLLDIEIVVFIFHWIFFLVYFKGSQLNDFLDSIYWSFFIKSYYSYALVSSPVILHIFYQSETVITLSLSNIILYSSIGIILIFITVVIFYGFYEYPLKKLFKRFNSKRTIIIKENEDLDIYDNDDDNNDNDSNDNIQDD